MSILAWREMFDASFSAFNWLLGHVGIGRGQGLGDDEIGGSKAQQNKHKCFASPPREQLFEHRNTSLAVGAGFSDPVVDGQGCRQGYQHED